jgi:hypothetical protein
MRNLSEQRIVELLQEYGVWFKVKARTIATVCPSCGKRDKLSVLKDGGSTICYRGSCTFGGPKPFFEWVMLTAGISRQEAINKVSGYAALAPGEALKLSLLDPDQPNYQSPNVSATLLEVQWPPAGGYDLGLIPASLPGVQYLGKRGVPAELASRYGICYNVTTRRVVIPIVMFGKVYGWQARAIDPVEPNQRMRNNTGFQRARCVMFLDRLVGSPHAIISEGPFDAIKFHACGGNVCTMGKVVTPEQLRLILSAGVKKIYLALDDDAAEEMRALQKKLRVPVFRVEVPQSAKDRCAAVGKKADFGECTFDECAQAFNDARPLDDLSTILHLNME